MNVRNPLSTYMGLAAASSRKSFKSIADYRFAVGSHPVVGIIAGPTPGRSDRVPMSVRTNSFIVPADAVSALGEGNSESGAQVLSRMFPTAAHGSGAAEVGIQASHGEYLIDPETVRGIGHGSLSAGHRVLGKLVLKIRREHIRTLRGLKGPKL